MIPLVVDVITDLALERCLIRLAIVPMGLMVAGIEMSPNSELSESDNRVAALTKSDLLKQDDHSEQNKHAQGALSSLWQEAYENPVKTGLVVGAAVAGCAALALASKGRIAERFASNAKPSVLIIEDTPAMGMAMRDTLKAAGHEVTWVTGISKLNPLTAVDATGAELSIAGNKQFKVALLDGDLGKGMLTGPEIVSSLKREHIVTIGTSTVPSFNIAMKANGAEIAATKPIVFTGLIGNKIDFKQALRAPAETQAGLDALEAAFRSPEIQPLRKLADARLMEYFAKGN